MLLLLLACGDVPPGPGSTSPPVDTADTAEPPEATLPTVPPSEPDPSPPPPTAPTPPPTPVGSSCQLGPHARSFTLQVQHQGLTRRALVDLPPGYDGSEDLPVVLSFHGLVMNAASQRLYTGLDQAANARGWIAVHPEAAPEWNVLPGSPDIGFVHALLDELEQTVCVDERRVYSTGLSQGGHVSYMLGCNMPQRIAAIAPVAGSDFNVLCAPSVPVPNLHIHGTSDLIVSYNGGILYDSAPQVVEHWAEDVNGCSAAPSTTLQQGDVTCESRDCGADNVTTLCSVQGGGHTWPGAAPMFWLGATTNAISANQQILDFFAQHARP